MSDYRFRTALSGADSKPVLQSLYVDLVAEHNAKPTLIHFGFRSGVAFLKTYLGSFRDHGLNHVAVNLRFNHAEIEDTMKRLAGEVLPDFPTEKSMP